MSARKILIMAAVLTLLTAPPAHADPAPRIDILPAIAATANLRLLGVSDGRIAATRDGTSLITNGPAAKLKVIGTFRQTEGAVSDLTGDELRWSETINEGRWIRHTVDLTTGQETQQSYAGRPLGFTPQGWVGVKDRNVILHDGTGDQVLVKGVDWNRAWPPEAASDGDRTMVTYSQGENRYTALFTDQGRRRQELAQSGSDSGSFIRSFALTPSSEIWIADLPTASGTPALFRRDRESGDITSEPAPGISVMRKPQIAAAADDIVVIEENGGWIDPDGPGRYTVWTSSGFRRIRLAGAPNTLIPGRGGAVLDGNRVHLGISGDFAHTAGIYEVGDDMVARRSASVGVTRHRVANVALNGGRLYWTERVGAGEVPVRSRSVIRSSDGELVGLGATVPVGGAAVAPGGAFSASGRRVLVGDGVKQSGAYALQDGVVSGPLGARWVVGSQPADVFGARVVWRTRAGRVVYRNLAEGTKSRELVSGGAVGPVAVGRVRFAWVEADGRIGVRDVSAPVARYVKAGGASTIAVTDRVLSWTDARNHVFVLDLGDRRSQAVDTGLTGPYQVDNDLIAGVTPEGRLRVQVLPFVPRRRGAQVIDVFGPRSVKPGRSWSGGIDLTQPAGRVQVKISRFGRTVRSFTASSRQGQVDLFWDGKDANGRTASPGRYRFSVWNEMLLPVQGYILIER